jgi:hypothetical protein
MNWVRLWGFLDVLPANVVIEGGQEGDDKRGHNLSTYIFKISRSKNSQRNI